MNSCNIETPLGVAKLKGDKNGLASVSILDSNEQISNIIPDALQDCVYQFQEYFQGTREHFDLKLNPQGTTFQKKCMERFIKYPLRKNPVLSRSFKTIG